MRMGVSAHVIEHHLHDGKLCIEVWVNGVTTPAADSSIAVDDADTIPRQQAPGALLMLVAM